MGRLQISVGDLSELLRPALFIFAALASAFVLADARRRFNSYAAAAWALLALLFPAVAVPLYLAARLFKRRADTDASTNTPTDAATSNDDESTDAPPTSDAETPQTPDLATQPASDVKTEAEHAADGRADDSPSADSSSTLARARAGALAALKRAALPLVYLAAVLLLGALYFYLDYTSFDAHFARARQAKLYNQPERTVRELRAALRVREDAHARKLLGMELAEAGRWEEALAELRAAARGGEPDDKLAYREGFALENLGRPSEAAAAYLRFLHTELCAPRAPDPLCGDAHSRLDRLWPPSR